MPSDSTQSRSLPNSWAFAKLPCLPRTGFRIRIQSSCEVLLGRGGCTPEEPVLAIDGVLLVVPDSTPRRFIKPLSPSRQLGFSISFCLIYKT